MPLSIRTQKFLISPFRLLLVFWSLVNLSAADGASGTVQLAWDPNPETDIAGYRVHYGTSSGNLTRSLTVDTTPEATLSDLEPGALYYCAVQAFNTSEIASPLSEEIAFIAPGAATFPEISVEQASGSALADGQSGVRLTKVDLGSIGAEETFIIKNLGTGYLTGLAIVTEGDEFKIAPLETTTLAPGETISFTVTFTPTAAGDRVAILQIISDDADESPFDIGLVARGVALPEIAIQHPSGSDLTDSNATVHFSNSALGSTSLVETFTIKNTGTADLTGLAISASGINRGDFILGPPAVSILAPGASTTFGIAFRPSVPGLRSATLHVASNDADENPFHIILSGKGIAHPEISVLADAVNLTSGSATLSLGNCNLGTTTPTRTVTIRNTGTGALTGLAVASGGSEFKAGSLGATTLAPGATTTFNVSFAPSAAGTRAATLAIASNDADESPFLISLTGEGIAAPEILVAPSNGKSLVDGKAFINSGTASIGTTAKVQTFTIRNTGTATLAGLKLVMKGINPGDFSVTALKARFLAPGASTIFKVAFKPTKVGIRWGTIHIISNDADESSFDIVLTGTGRKSETTKATTAKTSLAKNTGTSAPPITGTAVIDGRKYRTLTITKTPGNSILPRDIEVSSDLVAWASGDQHTTVLLSNAKTLTVRDNIPITQDAKRYIRLKR